MDATKILQEAKDLQEAIIEHRRYLHAHAETGFNLDKTLEYVRDELQNMGYKPIPCGNALYSRKHCAMPPPHIQKNS